MSQSVESPERRTRLRPTGAVCLVYASFGMPIAMLGVAWPQIRDEFGRSNGELGLLAVAYGLGRMSTSSSSAAVLRWASFGPAKVAGAIGLGVACVLLAVAPSWPFVVAFVAAVGLASGVLDSLGARYLAGQRNVSIAGLATGSYGLGATLGPAFVAVTDDWRLSFGLAAAVAWSGAAILGQRPISWPAQVDAIEAIEPVDAGPSAPGASDSASLRRERAILVVSLMLFFVFVGAEVTIGQWMTAVFEDVRKVDSRVAGLAVSAFWAGITVGRLVLAKLRLSLPALVGAAAMVAVLVGATLVAPTSLIVPLMGLAGLALSPAAPTLFAGTADRVGVARAGAVSGWQLVTANASGIALPALTGVLVASIGDASPVAIVVAVAVSGAVLLVVSDRQVARRNAAR